jgi:uncharacterized protein YqeY
MSLKDRLNADLRDAMRAHDETRKTTLRGALTAIRNAELAAAETQAAKRYGDLSRADPATVERVDVSYSDDEIIGVLQRQVKQRQDSIEAYQKASRPDLAAKEAAEAAVLQAYLPQQMSREEIAAIAREVIAETGASGQAAKGKVMPLLMKRLAGRADGREINAVVGELLGR